jgi:CotH kinase protein
VTVLSACGSDSSTLFESAPSANEAGAAADAGAGGAAAEDAGGAGAGGTSALPDDAALFDPLHVLEVELTLSPADWDTIRLQSRPATTLFGEGCQAQPFASPFSYVHADVVVDGAARADVGLRKKGFLGSLDENKPSLKIAIDEYAEQELGGTRDITLNNAKQDPSYLDQCLGYAAFAAAGVPASRCNFAHVTLNGKDLGLYVHVEAIKKPMLRQHFASDDGNLYEGTLSDFRDGWLDTFEKKTNSSDRAHPELDDLAAAAAAQDSELLARLEAKLDVDEFLSFWATEVLLEHWDGYAGNQNNFYVYGDPTTGKTSLLPWGIDQLFGGSRNNAQPETILTTGVLAHRLFSQTAGRARFEARLRQILATVWRPDTVVAQIDQLKDLVAPFLSRGERATQTLAVTALKTRVLARRAELDAALAGPPAVLAPLRGEVCFREIGSVSGTFSTTWGTTGAADPLSIGAATLDAVVQGAPWSLLPDAIGAVAGPADDPASGFPASVGVVAVRADGLLGLLYFGLTPGQVQPGDVVLNVATAPSLLFELDPNAPNAPATILGTVFGTLHFDSAALTPGAAISGRYDGKLYASGLLGTQ